MCVERAQYNEEYFVVGNISELGRWKINNRMKRVTFNNSLKTFTEDMKLGQELKSLSQYKAIYSFTFYMYKGREGFQYLFMRRG